MRSKIAYILFLASSVSTAGVTTNSPNLPPTFGGYVSPGAVHACYPNCFNIDLTNIVHSVFTNIVRTPVWSRRTGELQFHGERNGGF